MLAVAGIFLIASSALLLAWSARIFHHPDPPAWARREASGAYVTLAIMLLAVLGLGALLKFGIEFRTHTFSLLHAALSAVVLTVAAVIWMRLRRGRFRVGHRPGPATAHKERVRPAA